MDQEHEQKQLGSSLQNELGVSADEMLQLSDVGSMTRQVLDDVEHSRNLAQMADDGCPHDPQSEEQEQLGSVLQQIHREDPQSCEVVRPSDTIESSGWVDWFLRKLRIR